MARTILVFVLLIIQLHDFTFGLPVNIFGFNKKIHSERTNENEPSLMKRSIENTNRDIKPIDGNLEKYLMTFGYLPQSDLETGAQRTEQQMRNAIRNLQFFAGLEVTGSLDPDTVDLLKKPRCGVPDVSHAGFRNRRNSPEPNTSIVSEQNILVKKEFSFLSLNQDDIHVSPDKRYNLISSEVKPPNLVKDDDKTRLKRYSLQGERWSHTNLTWNLKSLPPLPVSPDYLDKDLIRRELGYALDLWARPSKLTFTEVSQESKHADIQVFFHRGFHGDGYPFDGLGTVLAHAFFPGAGRGGDVHFDADENWTVEKRQPVYQSVSSESHPPTSLFAVAAHEFGHSLGLSHSSVDGSLMFPWYSSKLPHNFQLPQDDLDAITHLYGKREFSMQEDDTEVIPGPTVKEEEEGEETLDSDDGDITIEPPLDGRNGSATYDNNDPPDECQTGFDAVAMIRSEMWAFKGKYFWRISRPDGSNQRGDPVLLSAFWYGLPTDEIDHVDAVYERPDHRIVFFIGRNFFVLSGNALLDSGPIPLTQIGLPESVEKVDGAFRWGWNGKTYLFSGSMYWRFDEGIQHVELDYPRDLSMWKGVPENFDAVFQYNDQKTYFFKGSQFWEFDDLRMRIKNSNPTAIGHHWMHCPKSIKDPFKSLTTSKGSSSTLIEYGILYKIFTFLWCLTASNYVQKAIF